MSARHARSIRCNIRPEADAPVPLRWVVNLRCYVLSLLRIHRPDCEHCQAREKCGVEMRKRLDELNWRTQPDSLNKGTRGEIVEVDSKPCEVEASSPTPLAQQAKKAG